MQYVFGETSVKTGIKLFFINDPIVVENVNAGVITSASLGKLNASIPRYNADEPELTNKQCFFAKRVAIFFQIF